MIHYEEIFPKNLTAGRYVRSYTFSIGEITETDSRYITRSFPTFLTNFYFEFEGGLSEIKKNNKTEPIDKRTYVNCEIGSWSDIYQLSSKYEKRQVKNFKVDFYPNAVFEIFGVSPSKFNGYDIKVEDIWGDTSSFRLMHEEMENACCGRKMIEVFERELIKKIERIKSPNPYIPYFLKNHEDLEGFSRILGYSPRWIQKHHREIFGYSFRVLQGSLRFYNVIDFINNCGLSGRTINFSRVAQDFGYYDQAHFIKDFKKYTGMTPLEYTAGKFKNLLRFHW